MSVRILIIIVAGIAALNAACQSHPEGAALFRRERCIDCHTIRGEGGGVGPDLTAVGRKRSRDFMIEQIRNPKAHNPNSIMPSFAHLPEQDIGHLADYLSGLR
ncbi:MAG: hypothetical protein A2X56_03025 [Nitrospirae bacterium GWC2_57_13]|nr:MAG: hypothetical protein A2X56_03025 [Nitrospirae bacterium GWC2_57_13]OGW42830.1 MAG: hypothetical protein A2X57_07730 [Nitrospirae bacterium GWD2_57_8]